MSLIKSHVVVFLHISQVLDKNTMKYFLFNLKVKKVFSIEKFTLQLSLLPCKNTYAPISSHYSVFPKETPEAQIRLHFFSFAFSNKMQFHYSACVKCKRIRRMNPRAHGLKQWLPSWTIPCQENKQDREHAR